MYIFTSSLLFTYRYCAVTNA